MNHIRTGLRLSAFTLFLAMQVAMSGASAHAAELEGVKMPDELKVAGKPLKLNGMGMREATIFKVDVYAAGLYLETPSTDAGAILDSPGIKHLDMRFVRDVGVKDIREAWEKALKANCSAGCEAYSEPLSRLNAAMEDMKKGDAMSFTFFPKKVEVSVKGKAAAAIEKEGFSRAMLAVWLGPNPPNGGLKQGLLGARK